MKKLQIFHVFKCCFGSLLPQVVCEKRAVSLCRTDRPRLLCTERLKAPLRSFSVWKTPRVWSFQFLPRVTLSCSCIQGTRFPGVFRTVWCNLGQQWRMNRMNIFNRDNWLRYKDFTGSGYKPFLKVYRKCRVFGFSDLTACLFSKASSSPVKQRHRPTLTFPPFLFRCCRVALLIH